VFERFTGRARQVVVHAQEEARAFGHDFIGTEHLLIGLLRVDGGVAAEALASLGIGLDDVRAGVERIVGRGSSKRGAGMIPFTPRAKKVLELALREALSIGHSYIGTEHILLGIAREDDGVAARVLREREVGAERLRSCVYDLLGARGIRRPGRLSFGRRPAALAEMRAPAQWEYHVERAPAPETARLNELGQRGWELVGVVPAGDEVELVFKRPQRTIAETRRAEGA
jgi:ATP-dependent Clp protease ATP-binding subunit ClpC